SWQTPDMRCQNAAGALLNAHSRMPWKQANPTFLRPLMQWQAKSRQEPQRELGVAEGVAVVLKKIRISRDLMSEFSAATIRLLAVTLSNFETKKTPKRRLRIDSKQFHQISAEDCFLFGIFQEGCVQDKIDANGPVKWIVGSVKNVIDTDLGDE